MSEFGALLLLAERHDQIGDAATPQSFLDISPDVVIVADRPESIRTAQSVMGELRRLPREVFTGSDSGILEREDDWPEDEARAFFDEEVIPLLLSRQRVLVVAPSGALDAIAGAIDPAQLGEPVSASVPASYTFDKELRPKRRDHPAPS